MKNLVVRGSLLFSLLALTACGKSGGVTISSSAFSNTGGAARVEAAMAPDSGRSGLENAAAATPITEFKFCVRSVKLENESGEVERKDDSEEILFRPGLIDLSDGKEKSWGTVEVPTGFKVSKIKIKVHQDKELCGVDYSLRVAKDGTAKETSQDVEFKWKFEPAVEYGAGDNLKLAMNAVVAALSTGDLNSMKEIVESNEDSGSYEDK